jgi:hypothetical protein
MEPGPDVLDVRSLAADLEALSRGAEAAARAGGLLTAVGPLAARLQAAPLAAGGTDDAGDGWHAVRVVTGRDEEIVCAREGAGAPASLQLSWTDGALELVQVQVGDRFWGAAQTADGESTTGTDAAGAGPADRLLVERVMRGIREEPLRFEREKADREWTCEQCSWTNHDSDQTCAFCGGLGDAWAPKPEPPTPSEAPRTHQMTLPPDLDAEVSRLLGLGGVASVAGVARRVARGGATRQPRDRAPTGDVVLEGFAPADRAAVVQAVGDVLQLLGEPVDPARAEALVDQAPAVVCARLPAASSDAALRLLRRAGAAAEFRPRDD